MPNGHDRAWVRLCITINSFRAMHGTWPSRVRCHPEGLQIIRDQLLDEASLATLEQHIALLEDPSVTFVAEDDDGRQLHYGEGNAGAEEEDIRLWLGIDSLPEEIAMKRARGKGSGDATARFGRWLRQYLIAEGLDYAHRLFYDHGDPATDSHVVAIKGVAGEQLSQRTWLADIDLMLATPDGEIQLLIEIEERPLSPKKLLGDVFATLLCNQVAVRIDGLNHYFAITPQSRLIIAGIVPLGGAQRAKYEEVILPRLQQVRSLPSGIEFSNVVLILGIDLDDAIQQLEDYTAQFLEEQGTLGS